MKTIWIINDYAGTPYHGMEFRHYYLAREWIKNGYKVYIITATFSHYFYKLPKVKQTFNFEEIDGINYIWIKVPKYKNSSDKKRVLKWFIFSWRLLFLPTSKMKNPDVIIASPTSPLFIISAYRVSKKLNSKLILEIKDIWPLTLIEIGGISKNNPLIKVMSFCEKFGVKKADRIVSTLQNYDEYLKEYLNIEREFLWINNGVSMDSLSREPLPKEIIQKMPKDKFIVGYTGTLGVANALEYLLEASKVLTHNKDIFFVIVGDGKEKENLIKKYEYLENVLFTGKIKKSQIQTMLSFFDICYIGWRDRVIYRYGISANKLFDYMFASKAILHSYGGKKDIVSIAKCGVTVKPENSEEIKRAILQLYNMPKDIREELGKNGKRFVLNNFTYEKLANIYIEIGDNRYTKNEMDNR